MENLNYPPDVITKFLDSILVNSTYGSPNVFCICSLQALDQNGNSVFPAIAEGKMVKRRRFIAKIETSKQSERFLQ